MSGALARDLAVLVGRRRAGDDAVRRALYATDASPFRRRPAGFVRPGDAAQAVAAAARLAAAGQAFLPRGAGSSLAGQALTDGWVLDLRDLDGIGPVRDRRVRVEAGVRWGALDAALTPQGLRFGPNPSSGAWCTLGGMAATNAGGSRTLRAGKMRERTVALEVLDARGERVRLERGRVPDDPFWRTALAWHGPPPPPPATPGLKNSFGWGLDMIDGPAGPVLDPVALVVGSEGRLATVLALELELDARRPPTVLLRCDVPRGALGAVAAAAGAAGADMVEWVDPTTAAAAGLEPANQVDVVFDDPPPLAPLLATLRGLGARVREVRGAAEIAAALAQRKRALGALQVRRDRRRALTWVEDPTLPLEVLDGVLGEVAALGEGMGMEIAGYGHLGNGNLHLRPLVDPDDPATPGRLRPLYDEVYGRVVAAGGSPSGEHGNGILRAPLLPRYWPAGWTAMQRLKATLDPDGRLAPLPEPELDAVVAAMRPRRPTVAVPPALEPWLGTALDCHGCGACDRYCPATLAVAEEAATARSKAVLVRAVVHGELGAAALTRGEGRRVFDLCVDCDACLIDCLSDLKIPRLAEAARGLAPSRSLRDRALRAPERLLPLARLGDPLVQSAAAPACMALAGLDRGRRPLPMHGDPAAPLPSGPRREAARATALLVPGCATVYQRPEAVRALAHVLAALGYYVEVVGTGVCCGAPRLQAGAHEEARAQAAATASTLRAHLRGPDDRLFTAEATCSHTFRRWAELDQPAVAAAVGDVWALLRAEVDWSDVAAAPERIGYHVPCHARVEGEGATILELLNALPGRRAERLVPHCCGMAGTWGMKREWGELSRRIGADLPARVAACDRVVTDCVTCTQQIWDLAGTVPGHPIEVLWAAMAARDGRHGS